MDQFRLAIEAAPSGIITVDRAGIIELVNAQIERLFGYTRDELIGMSVDMLLPGSIPAGPEEHSRTSAPGRVFGLRKSGEQVHVEITVNPLDSDGQARRLISVVDVAERARAEHEHRDLIAELQHLAGSLIMARDAERARIARELHDGASQQLAGLGIALSGLKRRLQPLNRDDLQADVTSLQNRANAVASSLRDLSHNLHPSALRLAGLVPALTTYCEEVSREHRISVACVAEGDFDGVDAETAHTLYRITQEALHNVVKHAGAHRVKVVLRHTRTMNELSILDDGKGFDVARARKSRKGLGLVSINERVRLAGGTLKVIAERNKGTQVVVVLPSRRTDDEAGRIFPTL
jgi:PAS domain S-box-containing protein